jgi:uncharacterized SAM-binding protein YcdF (DUF218 family)
MFFVLSKLLAFLITPIIWIMSLLIFAFITKNQIRKRQSIVLSIALMYVFSNSFLFNEAMRFWELQSPPASKLQKYDLAVVLGGMLWYDKEYDRLQFVKSADRAIQAIDLYKKGKISKILFSGGSGSILHQDMKEALYARVFFQSYGVHDTDFVIESESNNTRENALFSKKIIDAKFKHSRLLLITSAFHMRRAIGCFEKTGLRFDFYSTDRYSGPRKWEFDNLLIPNTQTFDEWRMLLHEIIGFGVYKIAGFC